MQIVTKALTALNAIKTAGRLAQVEYQTMPKGNVLADTAQFPLALMLCVTDWAIDSRLFTAKEVAGIDVLFLTRQPHLDFDGIENESYIDDMKSIAFEFISILKADSSVTIEGDVTLRSIYNTDDTNTTGVALSMKLRENQGECLRYIPPTQSNEDNG